MMIGLLGFKFFEPLIWKICVGYTDDDFIAIISNFHKCSISFLSCGEDGLFLKREVQKKEFQHLFFYKKMKFYKDICFAWISNTYPELFTRRLTSYASQKYSRNIFNLFKCTSMDSFIWKNDYPIKFFLVYATWQS